MMCQACAARARLRDDLQEQLQRHLRAVESLARDVMTATPSELPLVEAEVEAIIGTLLRHAQVHPNPRRMGGHGA
jgi:hypothetical protein